MTEHLVRTMECSEVLEVLSDYVDGELEAAHKAAVEAHLSTCDRCTKFGGEFGAVVKALRQKVGAPGDVAPEMARRLTQALPKK